MATIKDVARRAGVSVATVSRVLNKSDTVTPRTRQRVLDAIREMDYNPNLLGRNLRQSRTNKILVLLPTVSNMFYSRIVSSIEKRASENGYNMMLCVTGSSREKEERYLDLLRTRLVDGVIFLTSEQSAQELDELAQRYPVVQCCEYVQGAQLPTVSIDNYRAARDAVDYLHSLGHERIAFLGVSQGYGSAQVRRDGYSDAMRDLGLAVPGEYVREDGGYSYQDGIQACRGLMDLQKPPTALFAVSDSLAVGAVNFLLTHGRRVGEGGISVIGFDDTALSRMYLPSITTVSQPRAELGSMATELLLGQISRQDGQGPQDNQPVIFLEHKLKIRESTGRL